MRPLKAAVAGGLVAGVVTTLVMTAGRKGGVLGKTLDRDAVDWIDDVTGSRAVIGDAGTSVVEFVNHLAASAAFAAAWPLLRRVMPNVPVIALAAAYGTVLYGINIGAVALVLGITEGERKAGARKATERWGGAPRPDHGHGDHRRATVGNERRSPARSRLSRVDA